MAEKKTSATKVKVVSGKKTAVAKAKTSTKTKAKSTVAKRPATKTASKKVAVKKVASAKKSPVKKKIEKVSSDAPKTLSKADVNQLRSVTFRVLRGATVEGKLVQEPQEFEVKFDDSTTVLAALEDIKGAQDGTLTFRRSCRASICGSCGMFINNRTRLACKTKVRDIVDGMPEKNLPPSDIVEIGPQKNQPVLKDLVVDIQPFYKKVLKITPFVQQGDETETEVDKSSFEQVNMVSNCIMCGSCYSDCTAMVENPDYLGPAALAKAFRFVSDPREGKKTVRLNDLSEKNGIWDCTRCGMCVDTCPKGVAPMEAIVKLRTRAIKAGVINNPGAKHAMVFKDDIATYGVLNEPFMLLKTLGLKVVNQIPNALNLAKKGKVPNPLPFGEVEGLDEVRRIYKELEKNPIDVETKQEDTGPGAG